MKIYNFKNCKGKSIPNQFIIDGVEYGQHGQYFQSYDSVIAFKPNNGSAITLDKNNWNKSITTGKYRNMFLNETKKETEKKIKSGEYILADLNSDNRWAI